MAAKVAAYEKLQRPLRGIGLRVGDQDNYPWIFEGTLAFDGLLRTSGIAHTLGVTPQGSHSLPAHWLGEDLASFFDRTLDADAKE